MKPDCKVASLQEGIKGAPFTLSTESRSLFHPMSENERCGMGEVRDVILGKGEGLDSEVSVFMRAQPLTATTSDQDESKTFPLTGLHSLSHSRVSICRAEIEVT